MDQIALGAPTFQPASPPAGQQGLPAGQPTSPAGQQGLPAGLPTSPAGQPAAAEGSAAPAPPSASAGLGIGGIIGIVVGVVVALLTAGELLQSAAYPRSFSHSTFPPKDGQCCLLKSQCMRKWITSACLGGRAPQIGPVTMAPGGSLHNLLCYVDLWGGQW